MQNSNLNEISKFVHEIFTGINFSLHLNINSISNNRKETNEKLPAADTGNASSPSPHNKGLDPVSNNQLLDERAEKYLRESANIEDEPDAQDQMDADEIIKKEM